MARSSFGNYLIVNERAPVRVYKKYHLEETREFKNMAEFKAWYVPGAHGLVPGGINSQYLFTDILLEWIGNARVARRGGRGIGGLVQGDGTTARVPRGGGTARSRVDVDGTEHGSVYRAFEALGLPIPAHAKFRAELKREREKVFTHDGKSYKFKVVE